MELFDKIKADIKEAMKAKDTFKRDTLRGLQAAIKQEVIDNKVEASDDIVLKIIQKLVKQREDAATQYKDANREDLFEKESKEADILKSYLPKQLSDDELEEIVQNIISKVQATSPKDMGRVMKPAREEIGSKADGKRISQCVKRLLSN
jgi:uncharacterized protein YqeY